MYWCMPLPDNTVLILCNERNGLFLFLFFLSFLWERMGLLLEGVFVCFTEVHIRIKKSSYAVILPVGSVCTFVLHSSF